jgi:hypothetical protein
MNGLFALKMRAAGPPILRNQLLGVEVELAVEPGLLALHDVRAVLLARMGGLFSR